MYPTEKIVLVEWLGFVVVIAPLTDVAVGAVHITSPIAWNTNRSLGGQFSIVKTVKQK